jgi:hypothetical protein
MSGTRPRRPATDMKSHWRREDLAGWGDVAERKTEWACLRGSSHVNVFLLVL